MIESRPLLVLFVLAVAVGPAAADPAITRDGAVDLADLGEFTVDFVAGAPVFRSDLVADGSIDIADLGTFAIHFGDACF